ncbi:hypothetical protein [Hymenobacter sp. YC55]|uniref:hypothetical protein n=1 Tax=Hymenobacter sp. YC55 TaxID=3034019 RepID=UPI0023F93C0E|nr:hypothetical protein [Hymenobacter sp. YC55]MDF7814213.1 hypothetical protein [Hymenobacter sp. YC55]
MIAVRHPGGRSNSYPAKKPRRQLAERGFFHLDRVGAPEEAARLIGGTGCNASAPATREACPRSGAGARWPDYIKDHPHRVLRSLLGRSSSLAITRRHFRVARTGHIDLDVDLLQLDGQRQRNGNNPEHVGFEDGPYLVERRSPGCAI